MNGDFQIVEFLNNLGHYWMPSEVKEDGLHFCPILKEDEPLMVADKMVLVVDLPAWNDVPIAGQKPSLLHSEYIL